MPWAAPYADQVSTPSPLPLPSPFPAADGGRALAPSGGLAMAGPLPAVPLAGSAYAGMPWHPAALALPDSPAALAGSRRATQPQTQPQRVRLELQIDLHYDIDQYGADFVFNIHAAHTPQQSVHNERLQISQDIAHHVHTEAATGNRYLRLHAGPGPLDVRYAATVDITHHRADPATLEEVPVRALPQEVMGYILPSRYCQSDRLLRLATNEFGALPQGHSRVQAICEWVRRHVAFTSNTSNFNTSAVDTLIEQVGVCRDFAHLMIALCRAVNIPARFATGTDYGADPALGPPDFHAYVEAYLGGRWYLFDPSGTAIPMGMLRFGTGRDAADVAFATMFGGVRAQAPVIQARAVEDPDQGLVLPRHCAQALSTDAGPTPTAHLGAASPAVA